MNNFDDRTKAEERLHATKEEKEFMVRSKRARMLGLWAADLMGITGDAASEYAQAVVKADLAQKGDEDIYDKLMLDLRAKNVEISEHQLRREMDNFLHIVRDE